MRRRRRDVALAMGVAAVPLLVTQRPASAAESFVARSGSLEFITFEGHAVQCDATVEATHDADASLLSWNIESSSDSDCDGFYRVIAGYVDGDGAARSVRYTTSTPSFGGVDGAHSPTSVTLELIYAQCDAEQSDTCTLSVTASPK